LNRVLRCTSKGWEYEPDLRHAELVIEALGLKGANGVTTPIEKEDSAKQEEVAEDLSREDCTRYRAIVARANYLALDRADIQYAVKELCRSMSAPTKSDWEKLKRLGRYLVGKPRMVSVFEVQTEQFDVEAYGDSNWAG
jgi:hypothetical protein